MTLKQRLFVKKYVQNNGNGTMAASEVYDVKNDNVAGAIASENLRKPSIQRAIREALEAEGLTPDSISEYLKKAIISGLGNKATNSDALRGIDLYARLTGAFEPAVLQQTYKMKLQKLSDKELVLELERTQKETTEILKELKS